ncbi:MAG: helix-turn-helix transcriptional regulator [Actinomycetota bacterium]
MQNRLEELRAVNGWSQAHLADLLGTSRQTVNAPANGRDDPSLPLAFRLAHVFDSPNEDLCTPSPDDLGTRAATPPASTPSVT